MNTKEIMVVYPGSFDPFTRGHENIVRRAVRLFPRLVIPVAKSAAKNPLFSLEERVAMIQYVLTDLPQVNVVGFESLLGDFMSSVNATVILRGLRAVSDFEFEFQMAGMNRRISPDVETLFLTPDDPYMFVSSTMVREIAYFGGDVSAFVAPNVAQELAKKREQRLTKKINENKLD